MFRLQIKCQIYSCDINIEESKIEKFLSNIRKEIIKYKYLHDIDQRTIKLTVLIFKL